jgi:hypothetical protein
MNHRGSSLKKVMGYEESVRGQPDAGAKQSFSLGTAIRDLINQRFVNRVAIGPI